jgi:hypothetical protein
MAEKVVKLAEIDGLWEWQYTIKDEQGQRAFTIDKREMLTFFFNHFDDSLSSGSSNLSQLISDLINQDDITEKEAEMHARQLHKAAAIIHAKTAFQHFSGNFVELLNTFFKMAQVNAIQQARAELSKKPLRIKGNTWEEPWELVFRHPEQQVLQDESMEFFIAQAKKLQKRRASGRRKKVTVEVKTVAPELFQETLELCEEIKKSHDLKKAMFDHERKRNGYSHDEWISAWLKYAEERFRAPDSIPNWFFPRFASIDSSESTPTRIALELVAGVFDIAPSTLEKYCIRPARRKSATHPLDKKQV